MCVGSGDPVYYMNWQFKYSSVEVASSFSWDQHIKTISAEGLSIVGLIKRTIYIECPEIMAYTFLVRPILEYACRVWDLHLKTKTPRQT